MNDFVERTLLEVMRKMDILTRRLSIAEDSVDELNRKYNELSNKFATLQKNYDELLSLLLEK